MPDERARQMYEIIVNNPGLTEGEIADRVGLKKTPYTRWILFSLIEGGHVVRFWDETRPRKAYTYFVQQTQPLEVR